MGPLRSREGRQTATSAEQPDDNRTGKELKRWEGRERRQGGGCYWSAGGVWERAWSLPWWKLPVRVAAHQSNRLCLKTVLQGKQFALNPCFPVRRLYSPPWKGEPMRSTPSIKPAHWASDGPPWSAASDTRCHNLSLVELSMSCLTAGEEACAWFPLGEFSPLLIFRFFLCHKSS